MILTRMIVIFLARALFFTFRSRHVAFGTGTLETALHIRAGPVPANPRTHSALVHVHTARPAPVQDKAARTRTTEGAVRVDAVTALAEVSHHLTLVEVLARPTPAQSQRAQLLKLWRGGGGAGATGWLRLLAAAAKAPGPPLGAAAGPPAHAVRPRSQAEPAPDIIVYFLTLYNEMEMWWLIGSAPDFWDRSPGFESGTSNNSAAGSLCNTIESQARRGQ